MVKPDFVARGDVHLISLEPTVGSEIRKTRPCLIRLPGRVESAPADRHRGADDDGRPRVSLARAVPLSAAVRLCGGRSDSHGRHPPADQALGSARCGNPEWRYYRRWAICFARIARRQLQMTRRTRW